MGTAVKGSNGVSLAEASLGKASSGAHAVVDSVAEAADEAARKARPAIDKAATVAHNAVDRAAGAAGPAAEWLAEQGDNLQATRRKLMADTCSYVSANPMKSVGVAIATGFLLSRILR